MIDRKALITRNNPVYTALNKDAPLSVGNGKFCFTADFTGMQTFFDEYSEADDAFPLCTLAEWGWHSCPAVPGDLEALRLTPFDTYGRTVSYAVDEKGQEERFKRIRQNPHKFHLGIIAFEYEGKSLSLNKSCDVICCPVCQTLDMWRGVMTSEFTINGTAVTVETFVHPDSDTVFFGVKSQLLKQGNLRITIKFPYGSYKKSAADFNFPENHLTYSIPQKGEASGACSKPLSGGACNIALGDKTKFVEREMDGVKYRVHFLGTGFSGAVIPDRHTVIINPDNEYSNLEIGICFDPLCVPDFEKVQKLPVNFDSKETFSGAAEKCRRFWEQYWNSGGVIDFSLAADKRAAELERRIVLSQYLLAIQSRGLLPPAETGHTFNSWYGKFHLEMHYWHHACYALWNRAEDLKRSLAWYKKILPRAKEIAASQGYAGARWPKMTDPSGFNAPSAVAVLILWQQPHPIMFAELCYRITPDEAFLREYREVIVETAEFMKSFVHWEEDNSRYVVGPPYIPVQERHKPGITLNAAFELEYFRWGFRIADLWLRRLGETSAGYGEIAEKLSLPAHKDGVYLAHENCPETFSVKPFNNDHPSMLMMYGVIDSDKVDPAIMSATLDKVLEAWDLQTFWGWDFPVMAMTACRLGRKEDAVNLLLMDSPKNHYLPNGHNRQTGSAALPSYLPGNGGILIAAAIMAAGFGNKKGCSFPEGFNPQIEGITPYI